MPEAEDWQEADKDEIIRRAQKQAEAFGGLPGSPVNRVGVIYEALIKILADHRRIPDSAFQADSVPQQAGWDDGDQEIQCMIVRIDGDKIVGDQLV